jgi:hypothetical protein
VNPAFELMNITRNGKIARLPRAIRDELNRRLSDGELGGQVVAWLNALPEAQAVIAKEFNGRPIREQNLSEWRNGGYREWLAHQDAVAQARDLAADAGELSGAASGSLANHLATVLTARYAAMLAGWDGENSEEFGRKLRVLRALCQDIVELRRGDHSAARLQIEQERLERDRLKTEEDLVEHFQRWAKNPKVHDMICRDCLTPEERERRLRAIFGLSPVETAKPAEPANPEQEQKP